MRDLEALASRCEGLRDLRLQELDGSSANPVCSSLPAADYRARMAELFPGLHVLDGRRLKSKHDLERLVDEARETAPAAFAGEQLGRGGAPADWLEGFSPPPTAAHGAAPAAPPQVGELAALLDECHTLAREGSRAAARVRRP